jgi:hypothetical protein
MSQSLDDPICPEAGRGAGKAKGNIRCGLHYDHSRVADGSLNTLTYVLLVWVEALIFVLAGHPLARICPRAVKALVGSEPGISTLQSQGPQRLQS